MSDTSLLGMQRALSDADITRLTDRIEAAQLGATAIPKSFWDTWFTRQRKALSDRQQTVRKTLNTLGQTPTGSNEIIVEPGELE